MKELDEVIAPVRLITLKSILDEMIYLDKLSETERDEILNKAGLKKVDGVWVDEMDSEYPNL